MWKKQEVNKIGPYMFNVSKLKYKIITKYDIFFGFS